MSFHNIPDDCRGMVCPWEEEEWHCPECGGNEADVDCTPDECRADEEE